jgi:hypothetical protein
MREVTVTVNNGTPHKVFTNNIVKFLSEIDAQPGTVEESGMEHLLKAKIEIEEEESGEKWWSPLSPSEVYEAIARA